MTTRFIFVRHGESLGNVEKKFVGHGNVPLSEKGQLQAEKTALYLKDREIDFFYASDLSRAYETGKCIADIKGKSITKAKELREIYASSWEGHSYADLETLYPEEYGKWLHDLGHARCTNGESVEELFIRVNSFVEKLRVMHPGKTILCATHATPIRVLKCHWLGLPVSRVQEIPWVTNASVTVVDYRDDGAIDIIEDGENSYMGDLATGLPKNV